MRNRFSYISVLLLLLSPVLYGTEATETAVDVFQGVRYLKREESVPDKQIIHIVEITLNAPGLRFLTTPDNGEEGPRETWCETTREFVKRTGAQVGINGNYFINDGEAHTELLGLAVSNGEVVSPWDKGHAEFAVNISRDNKVTFLRRVEGEEGKFRTEPETKLYTVLSGNVMLVKEGRIVPREEGDRHPRTGLGVTSDNKLLLMIVDGRQPLHSAGMTYHEMAETFLRYGAVNALALDGGGSATLVFADPKPRVVNAPMPMEMPGGLVFNPPGIERKTGNNLAIFAAPLEENAGKPASPP